MNTASELRLEKVTIRNFLPVLSKSPTLKLSIFNTYDRYRLQKRFPDSMARECSRLIGDGAGQLGKQVVIVVHVAWQNEDSEVKATRYVFRLYTMYPILTAAHLHEGSV